MIATILPSSSSFHAVAYNENKVAKGSAFLMEMKNFGVLEKIGYESPADLVKFLNLYSSSNDRVKKPQFHMAFSCKGEEMTHEELLDFAHQYLKEMGYGEEGQPLLVYAHSDTDNNHIHVITSRVDPNGKKINDSRERVRSQKVIEKLLGENKTQKLKEDLADIANNYNYRSVNQFRAILEGLGYDCYIKDEKLRVKKGGRLLAAIPKESIEKHVKSNELSFNEPDYNRMYGIFSRYRDMNTNLDGLKKDLRDKFGLQLVTLGKKNSPYGYFVVDFKNHCVYEGSKIMSINKLNNFQSPAEWKSRIDRTIYNIVNSTPGITERQLNVKLRRQKTRIKDGFIICGDRKVPLSDTIKETLAINEQLNWINKFRPQNEEEFKVLAIFAGLDTKKISIPDSFPSGSKRIDKQTYGNIRDLFTSDDINDIRNKLNNAGFTLITINDKPYIYSEKNHLLKDISSMYKVAQPTKNQVEQLAHSHHGKLRKPGMGGGGSGGANREWEVGSKRRWDEVDDGKSKGMSM